MDTEFKKTTKRKYNSEPSFLYSGHSANCNCSCYSNETRLGQQRHSKRRETLFNLVGSSAPPSTLGIDSAPPPYEHSLNDWRTSSTYRAEPRSNLNSTQYADPTGNILNWPMACLSEKWSDNLNLDFCGGEEIHEPIASGSPWISQILWDSGESTRNFSTPKEGAHIGHFAQDIGASNSNNSSEFLPTFLPTLESWPGTDFNLFDHSWSPLGQLGKLTSSFDNSGLHEVEVTNLFITSDSPTNPIKSSSDLLYQQTISSDPPFEESESLNHSFSLIDTDLRYSQVQASPKIKWDKSFLSSDITPSPSANNDRVKSKTQHLQKAGKRQGPLKPENALRAAQTRRQRACWSCWLSKVPCSPEMTCHRCRKLQSPFSTSRVCNRTRLSDYSNLFFPEQLIAHLQMPAVQKVVDDNVSEFSKECVEIMVTSGQGYPTMKLNVQVFRVHEPKFLAVCRLDKEALTSGFPSSFGVTWYALPLGLPSQNVILLRQKCSDYIECMVSEESDWILGNNQIGGGSGFSWRVLNSIERYRRKSTRTNEVDIMLQKATMLYAMHDFMVRVITIADDTGYGAFEYLDTAKELNYDFKLPSKILNRQLKHAMHLLLQETTRDVLNRLERELKTRTEKSWAPCFCTILILCICIEELQIAVDGFAIHKATRKSSTNCFTRVSGFEASKQLDDYLYKDCKMIFHTIYKSHKSKSGVWNNKGAFNPIRDAYDVNEEGVTQAMHDLVGEIREILGDSGSDIVGRAKAPSIDMEDESLAAHMAFRERNSGRLVSDFLRSFLESTA